MQTTCDECGKTFETEGNEAVDCPGCGATIAFESATVIGEPSDVVGPPVDLERSSDSEPASPFDGTVIGADPNADTTAPSGGGEAAGTTVGELFGDYELLGEIARGGMGVVFRARQRKLNRTVALKMILSSHLATDEDVARFHAEAEAAARLDHSGIVPVYEVGEIDGQHFFSMGLVEGGCLKDVVREGAVEPKRAAELVKAIAEAVHYAHTRNIVHRDLKPANVLLDAEGRPKVTDFGLAKDVEADSGMTTSGQIMGTPGYMPPEQASGRTGEVGPLADVYALGGILYFLVTRRPPFHGESVMDTLRQVIDNEPTSPRVHEPTLDADVETICLKCLEKDPAKRYASAAELAEELQRYVDGHPIEARPVGRTERFRRWCLRNPLVAGLSASAVVLLVAGVCVSSYFAYEASRRATAEGVQRGLAVAAADKAERERAAAVSARKDADQARERADANAEEAREERDKAKQALAETRKTINDYVATVQNAELLKDERFRPLLRELLADAVAHYERFVEENEGDAGSQRDVAATFHDLGIAFQARGDQKEAEQLLSRATDGFRALLDESPDDVDLLRDYIGASADLAKVRRDVGKPKGGAEALREAFGVYQAHVKRVGEPDPAVEDAYGRANMVAVRYSAPQARMVAREASSVWEARLADDPTSMEYRALLAETRVLLSSQIQRESRDEARELARSALEVYETLSKEAPESYEYALKTAESHMMVGGLASEASPDEEIRTLREVVARYRRLADDFPNERLPRYYIVTTQTALAARVESENVDEAIRLTTEAIGRAKALVADYPNVPMHQYLLSQALVLRGNIYNRATQLDPGEPLRRAEGALENVVELLPVIDKVNHSEEKTKYWNSWAKWWIPYGTKALGPVHPTVLAAIRAVGQPELDELLGRVEAASDDVTLLVQLADLHVKRGETDLAAEAMARAIEAGHPRTLPGNPTFEDARTRLLLVLAHRFLGDEAGAKASRSSLGKFFSFDSTGRDTLPVMLAVLNQDLEVSPDDATLLTSRARTYARLQLFDEAFDDVTKVASLSRTPGTTRTKLIASISQDFGDLERSIAMFTELIERDPTNVEWRRSRGSLRAQLGRWHEAVEDYAVFVPESPHAWERGHLAQLARGSGLLKAYQESTRTIVDEFLSKTARTGAEEVLLVASLGNSGIPAETLAELVVELEEDNKFHVKVVALALHAYRSRKYEESLAMAEQGIPKLGANSYGLSCSMIKAMCLARLKREDEARQVWETTNASLAPDDLRNLAWWDRLRCELLRDEAAALLPPKPVEPESESDPN